MRACLAKQARGAQGVDRETLGWCEPSYKRRSSPRRTATTAAATARMSSAGNLNWRTYLGTGVAWHELSPEQVSTVKPLASLPLTKSDVTKSSCGLSCTRRCNVLACKGARTRRRRFAKGLARSSERTRKRNGAHAN
eukprot:211675-Pleurochrysis_carterae.AAC.1